MSPPSDPIATPPPRKKALRSIFGNSAKLLGGKGFNAVLSLAYLALAGRSLGIEQFGLLMLVHGYAQAISDLSKFQSWQVMLHYGQRPYENGETGVLQRVLRFSVSLDLISAGAGVLIAWIGILIFGDWMNWPPGTQHHALWYVTSIALMVNTTPIGLLRLVDRFDLLALRSGGGGFSRMVGAAICWYLDLGLLGFLVAWYLATAISFFWLFSTCWKQLQEKKLMDGFDWRARPSGDGFPGIWRFVWSTNLGLTLSIMSSRLPVLLVGGLLGPADAGLYRVAKQFADGIGTPMKLIVVALYPELIRLRDDWSRLLRLSLKLTLICGSSASVLLLIVALAGEPLLGALLGEEFRRASTILSLLSAGAVIGMWGLALEPLLITTGRAGLAAGSRVLVLMIQLPSFYVLTMHYGLTGAGLGAIIGAIAMLLIQGYTVWRGHQRQQATAAPR